MPRQSPRPTRTLRRYSLRYIRPIHPPRFFLGRVAAGLRCPRPAHRGRPPSARPVGHPVAPQVPGGGGMSRILIRTACSPPGPPMAAPGRCSCGWRVCKDQLFCARPVADSSVSVVQPPATYAPMAPGGILRGKSEVQQFSRQQPINGCSQLKPYFAKRPWQPLRRQCCCCSALTRRRWLSV